MSDWGKRLIDGGFRRASMQLPNDCPPELVDRVTVLAQLFGNSGLTHGVMGRWQWFSIEDIVYRWGDDYDRKIVSGVAARGDLCNNPDCALHPS